MENILFITDSASDLEDEIEKKYPIKILDFKVQCDGKEFLTRKYSKEEFYDLVENCTDIPTTSQISPLEFVKTYSEAVKAGYNKILIILINSKGSGTYNNSLLAKTVFFEENPDQEGKVEIESLDGCSYTGAYGQVVLDAAELAKKGTKFSKIVEICSKKLPKRKIYFGCYSLKFAGKSGRIPSAAAFIGEALAIKPVLEIYNNEIVTAKKIHGDKKLIPSIIDITEEEIVKDSPYSVVYGSDPTVRDEMVKRATERFGYPPVNCYQIGAAIAINAGPKVIGLIFDSEI